MADQYLGDNIIPGLNVKNVNAAVINPLMQLGGQIGSAYDQYGKGLRSALGQDQDAFSQQFLAGQLLEQRQGKDYTVLGVTYDGKTHRPKGAPEGGYSLSPDGKMTAHTVVKEPVITDNPDPNPPVPAADGPKLDPNATKDYKAAFEGGQKNEEAIQQMYADRPDLQQWAKANPALAYKEFKKAGMAGKEPFAYNDVEFGKLQDNPAEAAEKLGIKIYDGQVEQTEQQKNAQAFKNTMTEITKGLDISKYKDLGYNPFQIDPGALTEQSVDFNVPGLEGRIGNYGAADYGELLKKYPNVFSYK